MSALLKEAQAEDNLSIGQDYSTGNVRPSEKRIGHVSGAFFADFFQVNVVNKYCIIHIKMMGIII